MDEQNFDKIFGDKLKADKAFTFTEEKWDKMEKHLDNHLSQQRKRRFAAWLTLPFVALLGLLGFMGWSLHNAQNNISTLTQEVKNLRIEQQNKQILSPSVSTLKSDTVYHHIVVRRYDTIFQTVVRRDLTQNSSTTNNILPLKSEKIGETEISSTTTIPSNNNIKTIDTATKKAISQTDVLNKKTAADKKIEIKKADYTQKTSEKELLNQKTSSNDSITQSTQVNQNFETISKTPLPDSIAISPFNSTSEKKSVVDSSKTTITQTETLQSKTNTPHSKSTEKTVEIAEPTFEKQEQKHPPIIKRIKIDGCEVGLTGGLAVFDGKNILRQNGFSGGIKSSIRFGEHLKVVGEAQFLSLSYDVGKITGELDIPQINPPTANDFLHEVRVEQPYWQYALGLQYAFGQKRLKPFIGASIVGQSKLEEKFEYQFINSVTGDDIFVKTMRNEDSFQLPLLRLNIGAEYPIWRKLKGQIEGSYYVKLSHIPQFKPLWQIKTAVLYRF